jgi:hypothetical protein
MHTHRLLQQLSDRQRAGEEVVLNAMEMGQVRERKRECVREREREKERKSE